MKNKICILLLITFAVAICGCSTGPSVDELQSEIEYWKEESERLEHERDYAYATAYLLNDLLEKRCGEDYLDKIMIYGEYDDFMGMEFHYYYSDFLNDVAQEYADGEIYNTYPKIFREVENSGRQNYDLTDWK